MNGISKLFLALFLGAIQGCVSFHEKINSSYAYDDGMAYIYGSLYLRTTESANKLGAALAIKNLDTGDSMNLEFDKIYQLTLVEIPPGNYAIDRALLISDLGKQRARSEALDVRFSVNQGEAAYIGEVVASADYDEGIGTSLSAFRIDLILDNYEASTKQMGEGYPWSVPLVKKNVSKLWSVGR